MRDDEPKNLTEWGAPGTADGRGRLFTCGRPGRGVFKRERRPIDKDTIDRWVKGLPETDRLDIVSLLGKKPGGYSEFGYYPFRSSKEIGYKQTFEQWLTERYGSRYVVHEFPTMDARGIPPAALQAVTSCVLDLVKKGRTVVIVDSAGAERTARVCEAMGYKPIR